MGNEKWEILAERCINWMHDVIECHLDEDTGEPLFEDSEKAIEDAEFIIECINLWMSI